MSGPSGCPCLKSASFLPHLPSSSFLTISHFQPLFVLLSITSPFLTSPPNPNLISLSWLFLLVEGLVPITLLATSLPYPLNIFLFLSLPTPYTRFLL